MIVSGRLRNDWKMVSSDRRLHGAPTGERCGGAGIGPHITARKSQDSQICGQRGADVSSARCRALSLSTDVDTAIAT